MTAKKILEASEWNLKPDEVLDTGRYFMTSSRRTQFVFPEAATVWDSDEATWYYGNGTTKGGVVFSDGGGGIPDAPVDGNLYGRKDGMWSQVPVFYSHETTFGRKGNNNIPTNTDLDLPFPWYGEDIAGQWGFDGEGGDPDRALPALLDGSIVGITINLESLSTDVELGVKINGVKHGTTWTVPAATAEFSTGIIDIPYTGGDKVIPFLNNPTANWSGIGIGCAMYTRGVVSP